MAKADIKMPEDFLQKVSKLAEKTDEIVPRVLEVGGKVMKEKVKSNLQAVIGKTKHPSRSTGELVNALGVTGARVDRKGNYNVKVGFAEPRKDGESNAKIANIIEHGKHDQPAKPFLKPAKSAGKGECIDAMKNKLEREIKNI
jgi:phage protein, HK97 gp10 family